MDPVKLSEVQWGGALGRGTGERYLRSSEDPG